MATATLDERLPAGTRRREDTGRTRRSSSTATFRTSTIPCIRIEALYAGTIVERRNGKVVRDLKTKLTEIGQVYVVVPVPDSVRNAGAVKY